MLTIASVELPPEPASVPQVREIVDEAVSHLPRRAREAVELVVSELATNCVVHAKTPFEVFVAADDTAVELVVSDRTGWRRSTKAGPAAGNGLLLVGLLATDWSAEVDSQGKRVWARLCIDDVPLT